MSLHSCCVHTRADAEVYVVPPHAGGRVCDGRHVGVQLHGTQRVLRAAVHSTVMIQVTLRTHEKHRHANEVSLFLHEENKTTIILKYF